MHNELLISRFLRQYLWRLTMCNELLKLYFLRQCVWRLIMCNELSSHVLTHKETGQCIVEYTQHELILTSLLNRQVLIDTDKRHHEKVWVHCLSDQKLTSVIKKLEEEVITLFIKEKERVSKALIESLRLSKSQKFSWL